MKQFNSLGNRVIALALSIFMLIGMMPTSVFAVSPSSLTTDIGEKTFVVGETTEFTFTTAANDDAGKYVLGTFEFSDPSAVEKLEYLESQTGTWYEFYGDFGPVGTGFPMTDATSQFRVSFNKAGDYTVKASMVTADGRNELCSVTKTISVARANPSVLTTNIGEVPFVAGKSAEFTFTTTANEDAGTYVLGTFVFSDPSAVEKLEYRESQTGNWYEFNGDFGPAGTGFPMTNATSQFRVTFNKVGAYSVTASMVTADNRTVLCSTTQEVTVSKDVSTLTTNIGNKTFVIGKTTEFTFTTTANADAGTYVFGSFEFSDPSAVAKLEYLESQTGTWYELYGDFGPAGTGFPMTNATSQFRVTFNKVGTYTVKASMVTANDRTVLCSVEKTVTVADTSKLTTNIEQQSFVTGQTTEFTFTTTANGDAGTYVLGSFVFSDPSAIEKLEYLEVQSGQWFEFYGDFGPAGTGFPMTNATSQFRVTFKKAGNYTLTASIKTVADGTVLCKAESNVIVAASEQTGFAFESTNPVDQWIGNTYKNVAVGGQTNETIIYEIVEGPATIAADGTVTFTGLGAVTVKATRPGNEFYKAVSATYVVTSVKNAWEPFGFAVSNPTITYAPNLTYPNANLKNDLVGWDSTVTFAIVNGGSLVLSTDVATIDPATGELTILKSGVVTVRATRAADTLYTEATAEYTVTVEKADQTIGFETVTEVDELTYQTGAITLPSITGKLSEKDIVYTITVGEGEVAKIEGGKLQLLKAGYFEMTVVVPTDDRYEESNTLTWKVTVNKANQTGFDFAADNDTITYNDVDKNAASGVANEYTMITSGGQSTGAVTYEVVEGDAAIFNKYGVLTIKKAGTVKIKATKAGDEKYNATESCFELTVEKDEQSFTFNHNKQINEKYGLTSFETQITKSELNSGAVTYAVSGDNIGATVNNLGVVSFGNSTLKVGTITVTVTMVEDDCYLPFTETYTITLSYETTPAAPYALHGDKIINGSAWFTGDVSIYATNDYQISYSNDLTGNEWKNYVEWKVDGEAGTWAAGSEPVVYLKNTATGAITDAIPVNDLKRDTVKPNGLAISYEAKVWATIVESLLGSETAEKWFGFTDSAVKVAIEAGDSMSGIGKMEYSLDKGVTYTKITENNGKYEFTVPAEYRGQIWMKATDVAGNAEVYEHVQDSKDKILVIDSITPGLAVKYSGGMDDNSTDSPRYVNSDRVTVVFEITDDNFDLRGADPIVTVNGEKKTDWVFDATFGKLTIDLVEEGDYVIKAEFTDRLDRKVSYESEVRVDRTKPVIESTIVDGKYYAENQTFVLTITEHNFDAAKVNLVVNAVDSKGTAVLTADEVKKFADDAKVLTNWDHTEGTDIYTLRLPITKDGNYTVTVDCTDVLGWTADVYSSKFAVDKKAPDDLQISYSTPANTLWDNILQTITFGAYNPSVNKPLIVTLTANDAVAGVEYFEWFYTREDGASESNAPSGSADNANKLYVTERQVNSGVCSISFEVAPETRGYISFRATDRSGNTYGVDKSGATLDQWVVDSDRINIVDTIAPKREVIYTPTNVVEIATMQDTAQWQENSAVVLYYNTDAVATFKVTETNFYAEDVKVFVNGELVNLDKAKWEAGVEDNIWINTLTIAEEGDYVITMSYTDRSSNEMVEYESQRIVIDKTAPVIDVKYANTDVKKTIGGRDYLDQAQTATITVKDHNFRPDDVVVKVTAKDVLNNDLQATIGTDSSIVKSYAETAAARTSWYKTNETDWRRADDTYVLTMKFDNEANYTFDIEYQDMAKNAAADYTEKLFTVDTTAPKNLTVDYSTSVFEQIKESVTFGYYNAMMTVTITAEDDTSGIYHFAYSYIKGKDVSGVNAELLDQAIKEAEIKYEGNKATATFNIPKMVLGADNQFNGTVEFTAFDRSEITTELKDSTVIVVDNITPTSKITYNAPVQTANGISYYDGDINATIVVTEANFDAKDVVVTVTKDGENFPINVSWKDDSVDTHTGTFTLTKDGDYIVSVQYKDKSGNQMTSYKSNELTLDATKPTIKVSNIKANSANKDEKYGFVITVNDTNLDASSLKPVLKAVVQKEEGVYVTKEIDLGDAKTVVNGQTYTYTVEDLPDDGFYTLTCEVKDMSANGMSQIALDDGESYDQVQFSINRNGSAFGYGDKFTEELVGQYYIYSIDEDVVIVEVNVDPIEEYKVSLNGKELTEGTDYTTTQTSKDGEWSKRTYTIKKALFEAEGEYSIIVTSTDKAATTAFSDVKNLSLAFVVDQTKPVLTITGLEAGGRYQTNAQTVTLIPTDEGGRLNSLTVLVMDSNGNPLKDDAGADISVRFEMAGEELLKHLEDNDGKVTFTIPEGLNNQVKIICNDCAVNAEDLPNEYNELFERVTVSQNQFVIFYANTPLFVGTIAGVLAVAGLIVFLVKRKGGKKNKTAAKA